MQPNARTTAEAGAAVVRPRARPVGPWGWCARSGAQFLKGETEPERHTEDAGRLTVGLAFGVSEPLRKSGGRRCRTLGASRTSLPPRRCRW